MIEVSPNPIDVDAERSRRFLVTRPFGYGAGATLVVALGFVWASGRLFWLAGGMVLMALSSVLGRGGQTSRVAVLLAADVAWTGVVIAALGVNPLAATLLFAGHAVTGYLILPRRWARSIIAFIALVIGTLLAGRFAPPPELTEVRVLWTEIVMAVFGMAAIVTDLELIVSAIRHAARQRDADLERATKVSEQRASALRSVSHDVRTPLTSIGGFAHFLSEPEISDEDRVEFAHRISTEAAHLTHLVDDLLAAARLEAGQLALQLRPVDVLHSTKQVVEVFRPRGLDVDVDIDPEHVAHADSARLEQILRNLLSNAEKYGGSVARITSRVQGRELVLSVCDGGPGVPEHEREIIFQDFTQSGLASHLTGTGLGLGISRRLAHAMGGDLRCVAADAGACFELMLPAHA